MQSPISPTIWTGWIVDLERKKCDISGLVADRNDLLDFVDHLRELIGRIPVQRLLMCIVNQLVRLRPDREATAARSNCV
eukprot:SAG31_NODE_345_length_17358_cov_61.906889_6_plen_79_part_00